MAIYENPILSGSVTVSGSFNVQGIDFISSSNQIASDISGSFTATSASIATRFDGLSTNYSDLTNIPSGIISSSAQIDLVFNIDNVVSSSNQLAGDISGSFTTTSASLASSISDIISGTTLIASASYAISASHEITYELSSSHAQVADAVPFSGITGKPTLISGSNQIASDISGSVTSLSSSIATRFDGLTSDYTQLTNIPSGIISSSAQIDLVFNIDNVVSSSAQLSGSVFSGSFHGPHTGDGSGLTGISVEEVTTITDTFTSTTSKSVTHNFNSKNIFVSVYDNSDQLLVPATLTTTDVNTVTVTFDTATTGRVVVGKAGHVVSGSVFGSYREAVSGASTYNVTHNLNVEFPLVQSYLTSTKEQIIPSRILSTSVNAITVEFDDTFAGTIVVKK